MAYKKTQFVCLLLFDFQYIVNLNLLLFLKIISRTLYVSVTKLNDRYRF